MYTKTALVAALLCFCMPGISEAYSPAPPQFTWLAEASRTALHPQARQIVKRWYSAASEQSRTGQGTLSYSWANKGKTLVVRDSASNAQLAVTRDGKQLRIAQSVTFPAVARSLTTSYDERTVNTLLGVTTGRGRASVTEQTVPGGPLGYCGLKPQRYIGLRALGLSFIRPGR